MADFTILFRINSEHIFSGDASNGLTAPFRCSAHRSETDYEGVKVGIADKVTKLDYRGWLICDMSRIVTLCHKRPFGQIGQTEENAP